MFKFLQEADIPIHLMIAKKFETYDDLSSGKCEKKQRIKAVSPFNSTKKRSAVAMVHPFKNDVVAVYVKGAPEIIITTVSLT
jgi:magnesium-transporting ATPase (P-type)